MEVLLRKTRLYFSLFINKNVISLIWVFFLQVRYIKSVSNWYQSPRIWENATEEIWHRSYLGADAAAAEPSSDLGAGDESYGDDGTVAERDAATACGHVQSLGDRPAGEGRGAEEASWGGERKSASDRWLFSGTGKREQTHFRRWP